MSNSNPTLTSLTATITLSENTVNATPQLIDADVTFVDLDSNLAGSALTISGLLSEDIISIRNQGTGAGQIGYANGVVSYEGIVIGVAGTSGGTFSVVFQNATTTATAIDALIQNLTYANSSNTPTASRTLTLKLTDAAGAAAIAPPTLVQQTGGDNPLDGHGAGGVVSKLTFGDLDGDGDFDALAGNNNGTLVYFENTGTAIAPVFAAGTTNPFGLADIGLLSAPAFVDLDHDGDLDVVVGEFNGIFFYFENTGTAIAPAFTQRTGVDNPFGLFDVGMNAVPAFADLDGDGDFDAAVGGQGTKLFYFENTGSATEPAFTERTGADNPLDAVDLGSSLGAPSFADLDRDGDLDAVIGASDGTLSYFENTGTVTTPTFVPRGTTNPFSGVDVGNRSAPAFADLDGDGDADAVVGVNDGSLDYFKNITPPAEAPDYTQVTGPANPLDTIDIGSFSKPTFIDLDSDGDLDAFVGEGYNYFKNIGSATEPVFVRQSGPGDPFNGAVTTASFPAPAFADLDADGDLDALFGDSNGNLLYYDNIGTATEPQFFSFTTNPFGLSGVSFFAAPSFGDLDGDGDLDLVVGAGTGDLHYFRNDGSPTTPAFVEQTGTANPFNGIPVADGTPALADIDHDGDLDTVFGSLDGPLHYLENTGTAKVPAFVERFGSANPFDGIDVGTFSAPTLADLDGDGDADLAVGNNNGILSYFRNTGAGFELVINVTAQNDAPVVANPIADQSVAEETLWTFQVPANAFSDPDGDTLAYTATLGNGDPLPAWLGFDGASRTFSGTPPQDFNGPIELRVTASDASTNVSDTFTLNVTPVNDTPDNNEPGPGGNSAFLNYTENQAPTAINPTLSFTDPDDLTLPFGRVTIVSGYQANQDVLGFVNDGATMGNIAIVSNVGGVLTLGSAGDTATIAQWNNALHAVTYFNSSDTPSTVNRVLSYEVDDGGGFTVVDDATISITAVNDAANDFNGDGKSDILFQNSNGSPAIWLLNGTTITSQAMIGANPGTAWHVIGSGDINGDEKADVLFQHDDGTVAGYVMNGTTITAQATLGSNPGTAWHLIASGDFNGDHKDDLLWQHDDGSVGAWVMNGTSIQSSGLIGTNPGAAWNVIGTGDFNGDGKADILWQHDNGTAGIWLIDGTSVVSTAAVGGNPGTAWNVIGAGDFNGDGKADILWQHDNGTVGVWLMDGTSVMSTSAVGINPGPSWNVIGAFDVNGDGKSDVLFQHDNGQPGVWLMDGFTVTSTAGIGANPGPAWDIVPQHDLVV